MSFNELLANSMMFLTDPPGGNNIVNFDALGTFWNQGIGMLGGGLAGVGAFQIINGITSAADASDDVNPADKKKGYKTIAAGAIMAGMGIALVPALSAIFNFGP